MASSNSTTIDMEMIFDDQLPPPSYTEVWQKANSDLRRQQQHTNGIKKATQKTVMKKMMIFFMSVSFVIHILSLSFSFGEILNSSSLNNTCLSPHATRQNNNFIYVVLSLVLSSCPFLIGFIFLLVIICNDRSKSAYVLIGSCTAILATTSLLLTTLSWILIASPVNLPDGTTLICNSTIATYVKSNNTTILIPNIAVIVFLVSATVLYHYHHYPADSDTVKDDTNSPPPYEDAINMNIPKLSQKISYLKLVERFIVNPLNLKPWPFVLVYLLYYCSLIFYCFGLLFSWSFLYDADSKQSETCMNRSMENANYVLPLMLTICANISFTISIACAIFKSLFSNDPDQPKWATRTAIILTFLGIISLSATLVLAIYPWFVSGSPVLLADGRLIPCEKLLGTYFPFGVAFIPALILFLPPIAFGLIVYFYVKLANFLISRRPLKLVTIQVATTDSIV